MIINLILSILVIASCGYLTPRAVDLRKQYYSSQNGNIFQRQLSLALLIGTVSTAFVLTHWAKYSNRILYK